MGRARFQRGSGCFACGNCGRQTRDVGDNGGCGLCPLCYARATCGNALADSGHYPPDLDPWAAFDDCQTPAECENRLHAMLDSPSSAKPENGRYNG